MDLDRKIFFDGVRETPFGGKLSVSQVSGMEVLLDEVKRLGWVDNRHLAYLLATAYWETGFTMQPISEWTGKEGERYFFRMYDIEGDRPRVAQRLGNTEKGDGVKFHGRGYVQITGRANYADMSRRLSLDLVNNPDLVKNPEVAAVIACLGMTKGTFTGKKLSDYFNDTTNDPVNARRIINGVDSAEKIAKTHREFLVTIDKARILNTTTQPVVEKDTSEFEARLQAVEDVLRDLRKVLERVT